MNVNVYEGACGNYYITDKEIEDDIPVATFDSVSEAEWFVESQYGWEYLDRDLAKESMYGLCGDDYKLHTFDFAEEFVA